MAHLVTQHAFLMAPAQSDHEHMSTVSERGFVLCTVLGADDCRLPEKGGR